MTKPKSEGERKQRGYTTPHADKYLVSIFPDGRVRKEAIDKPPTHIDLNKIVGGYIECIPYFHKYGDLPCIAFCNEYGKLDAPKKLPINRPAQVLWEKAVGRTIEEDFLVGTIAIVVGPKSFLEQL